MKVGIVVCTRIDSRRVPGKCGIEINGLPILTHLHRRLSQTELPIIYAIPPMEYDEFVPIFRTFGMNQYLVTVGYSTNPLARMRKAVFDHKLDAVIRVTHDKIFIDPDEIHSFIRAASENHYDYIYSDKFTDGTSFEFIRADVLEEAYQKFGSAEHISYAIKAVAKEPYLHPLYRQRSDCRLLIDFPEDVDMMNSLFACFGNDLTVDQAINLMNLNPWLNKINRMPQITVYTCAYNAEQYLEEAIYSVINNDNFHQCEYLLIDDGSTDGTSKIMAEFASIWPRIKFTRLPKNMGLASASNFALENARGKYIVRLDADDYFYERGHLARMREILEHSEYDVLYPHNFHGSLSTVQKGNEHHHVGGSLFKTRALNHVKFTEGLKHYDGLDLFVRARKFLNIGYYEHPTFLYRQHYNSLSKSNPKERQRIKEKILGI